MTGSSILERAAKMDLTPQARRFLDDLMVIDRHSHLSWTFMKEVNLKREQKPNRAEEAARELLAFREANNGVIAWNWVDMFASPRAEKRGWEAIEWYRRK